MRRLICILAVFIMLFSLFGCDKGIVMPKSGENDEFEVVFLDVGQADCIYIHCNDQRMLIDGGNYDDGKHISLFLHKRGVEKLDYVVCTHPHEDHCGGLTSVIDRTEIGAFYTPVTEYDGKAFEKTITAAEENNINIVIPHDGDKFTLGEAEFTILGPVGKYEDENDMSIVLRMEYKDVSFIFAGDAGYYAEKDIIEKGYDLDADVLKVGHHGSSSSTGYVWLREIMPEYAVICVGAGNGYGHPSEKTLSRLEDADVKIYRTDADGEIRMTSDGVTITVHTENEALSNAS